MIVKPTAERLAEGAAAASGGGLPPVHAWDPPYHGKVDIRIARDGTWFHEGTPIRRRELVRLFSTILRKDGDDYVLVTPVEKVGITVDDAPFVAVDFDVAGTGRDQTLTFVTNVGDRTTAGPDAPIRVVHDPASGEPAPYVTVRANLEALIDRKSFYRLADLACDNDGRFGLWSSGVFFPIDQT